MSDAAVVSTPARMLRNIRVQSVAQGYGAIVSLIIPIIVVKLGVEEWAHYVVGAVTFAIVRVLSDFGVGALAIRDVARQPDRIGAYQKAQLRIRLAAASLCFGLMLIVGAALDGPRTLVVLLFFAVAMWLETLAEGYRWAFRARQLMERDALAGALERTATLLLTIATVSLFHDVEACAAAFAGGQLVNAVASRLLARAILPRSGSPWDPAIGSLLIRTGPTFVMLAGSWALYLNVDRLILWMSRVPVADVGIYGLAYMPLKGLLMVPEVVMLSMFPALAEMHVTDGDRLGRTVRKLFTYLAGGMLVCATTLVALEPLAVRLLLVLHRKDEETALLGPLMAVLVLSAPLYAASSLSAHLLAATGRQVRLTACYLLALAFNAAGNVVVAIPALGSMGCALMTLATESLLGFLLLASLPRETAHLLLYRTLSVQAAVAIVLGAVYRFLL